VNAAARRYQVVPAARRYKVVLDNALWDDDRIPAEEGPAAGDHCPA
jgi:hypothetical protein